MIDTPKDPTSYSFITYVWVLGLAILGGLVSFLRKLREGNTRVFNIIELIGEVTSAAFTGILVFWILENSGVAPLITAACVGIAGNMGSRGLYLLEQFLKSKFPA